MFESRVEQRVCVCVCGGGGGGLTVVVRESRAVSESRECSVKE